MSEVIFCFYIEALSLLLILTSFSFTKFLLALYSDGGGSSKLNL